MATFQGYLQRFLGKSRLAGQHLELCRCCSNLTSPSPGSATRRNQYLYNMISLSLLYYRQIKRQLIYFEFISLRPPRGPLAEKNLRDLARSQRDRLAMLDLQLRFVGEVRRHDLIHRFAIQVAAASRDIALYKELAPNNIEYNTKAKIYTQGERFQPLFDFTAERVLAWLSQGFGDEEPTRFRLLIKCETSSHFILPSLDILSVLTRAIYRKGVVEVSYHTAPNGLTTREVVPFVLVDNGFCWLVRGYDRKAKQFRDFELTRIADARIVGWEAEGYELPDQDNQWNRIVEMELVPHPINVLEGTGKLVELDYGMKDGVLTVMARAALAVYILRRWNVDCTDDHKLNGIQYMLWLRNPQTLYGVSHLHLAPGLYSRD